MWTWSRDKQGRIGSARTVLLASLVVLALVCGVVTGLWAVFGRPASAPSAVAAREPVDGYPQRIGFERPSSPLPDSPGALAATLVDNDYGNGRNLGVTARGRLWELTMGINALSTDGALLLTGEQLGAYSSRLAVHDLTSGERRVFDDIIFTYDLREAEPFRYLIEDSAATYWAQDGSSVLARFGERPDRQTKRPMVLDVATVTLTPVAGDHPAGFHSPTKAVTVSNVGGDSAPGGIVATVTDLTSGSTRDVRLQLDAPWQGNPDLLLASVSPDGSRVLLVEDAAGPGGAATARLFSLADGEEREGRAVQDMARGCTPTWLGPDPVIPTRADTATSTVVTAAGPRPLVAVHHRMQSTCLELTPAALEAGPHRALLGTRTNTWTWYWQPALALVLGMIGLTWLAWRTTRR